jgi:hypothetical protein
VEGVGGGYFEDCNEAPVVEKRPESGMGGVAWYAVDPAKPSGSGTCRST